MGIIYIIKNDINNKVYIGQTVQSLDARIRGHIQSLNKGTNSKIYKAIRGIGYEHFTVEVIEECDNIYLNEKEMYYIELYDSFKNGYNSTPGGDALQPRLIKYADEIIRMYLGGMSSAEIAKIYNCSDETILNMLKREEIEIRTRSRDVVAINLRLELKSYYEAAKYVIDNNYSTSNNVADVATSIRKSCQNMTAAYGIKFRYKDDYVGDKCIERRCIICGKTININSTKCTSCSQVEAKGKSPKPSKDELKALLDQGLQKKQIAELYDRTPSTVHYWIKSYEL